MMLALPGMAMAEETDVQTSDATRLHAQEVGIADWPGLTGTWGGARDRMEESGLTLEAVYTGEEVHNFGGGAFNKKGSIYHDNLDLAMTLDTEKAGMWKGGTFFVYWLRNNGGDPSANLIGDLQTASNIEAPNQFIVHEAWYEQNLSDGAVSFLIGLHDLNSEFYASDYASLYINSSFGIGPELSGNVPASLFPKAALGARLRIVPFVEGSYIQAAIYDGDPATRGFKKGEGHMTIAEAGYTFEDGAYKIGYWQHYATKTFGANTFNSDYGFYALIDQTLVRFEGDSAIGGFLQYGKVPANRNDITSYFGGGLNLHGLFPSRENDELGIALASAKTHLNTENTIEATYRMELTSWLAIQPSFQWIQNPGGDATVPTAKVGLFRFEVTL